MDEKRRAYNSSKPRIGEPMASQRDRSRQMVENDFSPPDSVFVCRPFPDLVSSGSTFARRLSAWPDALEASRPPHLKVKQSCRVIRLERAAEAPLAQKVCELRSSASRDESTELLPSGSPFLESTVEELAGQARQRGLLQRERSLTSAVSCRAINCCCPSSNAALASAAACAMASREPPSL